jgi:hypothetical protein
VQSVTFKCRRIQLFILLIVQSVTFKCRRIQLFILLILRAKSPSVVCRRAGMHCRCKALPASFAQPHCALYLQQICSNLWHVVHAHITHTLSMYSHMCIAHIIYVSYKSIVLYLIFMCEWRVINCFTTEFNALELLSYFHTCITLL